MANKLAFVLCCIALIFTTVAYGGVHQPILVVFYVLVSLSAVSLAVDNIRSGAIEFSRELLQIPLIGSAAYAFVQIIPLGSRGAIAGLDGINRTISLDPYSTWTGALQFTALAFFFGIMLASLTSIKRVGLLFTVIAIFGFAYSFFAILQSVLSPQKIYGIYDVGQGSPFGSFVNRNNFAAFAEMTGALPLGLLFAGAVSKDKRLLFLTTISLIGVSLFLSGSRGGLVALAAEIILLLFLTSQATTKKGLALRLGLIVLLIVAIVGGSVFVGGDTSLTRFAATAASEDFSTDRSHIWSVSAKVIAANMPFGAGFGAFGVAYTPFDTLSGLARVEQAHNDYLQVLADAGVPGLLLGLGFLFLIFRYGWRSMKIENSFRRGIAIGAFAGCFAVLVHSIFDFVLHVTAVAMLFLTLLAMLSASQKTFGDDSDDVRKQKRKKYRPASTVSEEVTHERDSLELPLQTKT
ncbi:MAG: O-antigen ligase family protein [Pyrinomonadaceae bacterium]